MLWMVGWYAELVGCGLGEWSGEWMVTLSACRGKAIRSIHAILLLTLSKGRFSAFQNLNSLCAYVKILERTGNI